MEIIYDKKDISKAAATFREYVRGYNVYCFSGDLGAGKTTFITGLCKLLGVEQTVTSPTYSIIQEYEGRDHNVIYHLDLYRLKDEWEAVEAGVEDTLNSGDLCLVEWPERVPAVIPGKSVMTRIEIISDTRRKMIIQLPT